MLLACKVMALGCREMVLGHRKVTGVQEGGFWEQGGSPC